MSVWPALSGVLLLSMLRTVAIRLKTCLGNPWRSRLKTLDLITSSNIFFLLPQIRACWNQSPFTQGQTLFTLNWIFRLTSLASHKQSLRARDHKGSAKPYFSDALSLQHLFKVGKPGFTVLGQPSHLLGWNPGPQSQFPPRYSMKISGVCEESMFFQLYI